MIASNPEDQVETITRNAFSFNTTSKPSSTEEASKEESGFESFMKEATKLKGVGPATASALSAMLNPEEEPFFSDELAEWMWNLDLESEKDVKGKGKASSQKIKIDYTMKFYREFRNKVKDFRKILAERGMQLNAQEIERVAWTLWNAEKFGVDLEEFGVKLDEEEDEEENKSKGKQNSKRKAIVEDEKTTKDPNHQESTKTSSSSTRSSKRTKSSKS